MRREPARAPPGGPATRVPVTNLIRRRGGPLYGVNVWAEPTLGRPRRTVAWRRPTGGKATGRPPSRDHRGVQPLNPAVFRPRADNDDESADLRNRNDAPAPPAMRRPRMGWPACWRLTRLRVPPSSCASWSCPTSSARAASCGGGLARSELARAAIAQRLVRSAVVVPPAAPWRSCETRAPYLGAPRQRAAWQSLAAGCGRILSCEFGPDDEAPPCPFPGVRF